MTCSVLDEDDGSGAEARAVAEGDGDGRRATVEVGWEPPVMEGRAVAEGVIALDGGPRSRVGVAATGARVPVGIVNVAADLPSAEFGKPGLATPAAIPIAVRDSTSASKRPRKRFGAMILGQDALTEVFFLQRYQIGGSEFLHERKKVSRGSQLIGKTTLVLL